MHKCRARYTKHMQTDHPGKWLELDRDDTSVLQCTCVFLHIHLQQHVPVNAPGYQIQQSHSYVHTFHCHFPSLCVALTSWVVILTAVWVLAGWQIGITDCLGYLDTKIAIKSTLIKLIFFSPPDMLRHIESHCNITDKDMCWHCGGYYNEWVINSSCSSFVS